MSDENNLPHVQNAEHVSHADHVDNAVQTEVAAVVRHADNVGKVEVHGEPLRTPQVRKLQIIRDIAGLAVVLLALLVTSLVIINKNLTESDLRHQISLFEKDRVASDKLTAAKLECTRRYQDAIDASTENQLILIGEFLVTIVRIPPGPDREAAVMDKITALDETNAETRRAIEAKIDYNNAGNPLPCPLSESSVPPVRGD